MAADKRLNIRMPEEMYNQIEFLAQKKRVTRANLIKYYLSEKLEEELKKYDSKPFDSKK